MTILPWLAFTGMAAGAFYIGWNGHQPWVPVGWQETLAVPLLICGALGIAIGLAGAFAWLLMLMA